jgi:ATP adenylyltransferase
MSEQNTHNGNSERPNNLWAPWRISYVKGLEKKEEGCFICNSAGDTGNDDENLVLWRTQWSLVMLNRYPYNNGHILLAPLRHISDLDQADESELSELMKLIREVEKVLSKSISPHGFNIGLNIGRCAGAGLPGHLHFHIVPRWDGDTNFMAVTSDTAVISQGLSELLEDLKIKSRENDLPQL